MAKLKSYILLNFSKNLISLFLPFFALMSVIYIINISRLSAVINLTFIDFSTMYLFILPDILTAAIPLTFIGATINTFAKLSTSSETTAIFSLGYSGKKLYLTLLPTALLMTILMLALTVYVMPLTSQKMSIFKAKKIYEEKLRVLPNKLSQNFNNKHIFIEQGDENNFTQITLFSKNKDNSIEILLAKSGNIVNQSPQSYLNLNSGTLYKYKNRNFNIINFENLKLYNKQKEYKPSFKSIKEYWMGRKKAMSYYIFISITPISTLLALIALGVYNNRYQKNLSVLYIFATSVLIYILAIVIRKNGDLKMVAGFSFALLIISFIIFRARVLKKY